MSTKLEIQVPKSDQNEIINYLEAEGIEIERGMSQHFGGEALVSLVIELTPLILSFIAGLYATRMAAKKHISFRYKGFEIKGVSEKTLLALLKNTQIEQIANENTGQSQE